MLRPPTALWPLLASLLLALPARAHDWNRGQIRWESIAEGLARAAREHKPAMLVAYTEWCPHCRNYAKLFRDRRIVAKSRSLVMILVDQDKEPQASRAYAPDGDYIPRTHFLDANGALDRSIHAPRTNFLYFYDENNPEPLLAAMDAALRPARR